MFDGLTALVGQVIQIFLAFLWALIVLSVILLVLPPIILILGLCGPSFYLCLPVFSTFKTQVQKLE